MAKNHHITGYKKTKQRVSEEDAAVLEAIRTITGKGNDAEIKLKPDGTLRVYEIKRTSYP